MILGREEGRKEGRMGGREVKNREEAVANQSYHPRLWAIKGIAIK